MPEPAVILAFILGLVLGIAIQWCYDRHKDKVDPMNAPHFKKRTLGFVVGGVVFAATQLYVTASTYENAQCTKELVQTFQTELSIAKSERESFIGSIQKSIAIQAQYPDRESPENKAATKKLTDEYLAAQAAAAERRKENQAAQEHAWERCG